MEDSYVSDSESEVDNQIWDDVTEVAFNYIKTGNSRLDGMLTTHDYHFKVPYSFFIIFELLFFLVSEKQHQQEGGHLLLRV